MNQEVTVMSEETFMCVCVYKTWDNLFYITSKNSQDWRKCLLTFDNKIN